MVCIASIAQVHGPSPFLISRPQMSSQPGQNVDFTLTAKAQQDHVVKLYNEIQTRVRAANVYLDFFRSTKEREKREIDALLLPYHVKVLIKTQSPRLLVFSNVLADGIAYFLMLKDFEKQFRTGWKGMREASVKEREDFITQKVKGKEKVEALLAARMRECSERIQRQGD
jgi:hypothetical protein